ncbi:MAG: bifunctional UDP-N-acetylglucosamine diphosphorylase/glucosamine-1-phosphate N-acetyltransferase GlmU [Clostridia bacterium]|nr:bifunctional UDP-N-acetylglucosamine diphosphorylase/glucosamine-1-phosphate N-acetyltransferase GlmU [Clostridia bacterium]
MKHLMAVILAAGEGKRMKSKTSKVVHKACGKPLIQWVYNAVEEAGIKQAVLVVGHKAEQVIECMGDKVRYVTQEKQLGTGHAVMQAEEYLKDMEGIVVVLCGDTPLITGETLSRTIKLHKESNNSATVITAILKDPSGYGRIIRDEEGNVEKIVEQRDASDEEKAICEINSGIYCFNVKELLDSLKELKNDNDQGEYYLTDTLEILIKKGLKVGAVIADNESEIMGINDRVQLSLASELLRMRVLNRCMQEGVTIIDPKATYIDAGVRIGTDTIIYPGAIIEGDTEIGEECIIGPNTRITDSKIGNCVEIQNSVIVESTVGDDSKIGPFAYLRPGSSLGRKVKVGDFVEIKKSVIGDKTKIPHLSYVGDAEVGRNVNLGCGTVVVNYDGKKKHKTIIGDNAFVGCNSNLVSPVVINNNSYIAAGSTITEEVPENSLAIARSRQIIKEDWVNKKGMKREEK